MTSSKAPLRHIDATYDELPYQSFPYVQSHPEHLQTIAKFMKMDFVGFEKARVLELGCAGGGNILPLAVDSPDAYFFGIDLSPVQIEEANAHKKGLGLTNVDFQTMDIMEFPADAGEFDYIIVHGVYSWVPDFVREKILEICKSHLSKKGMAVITFNALPGWFTLRSIREMMILHTKRFEKAEEKIAQAKYLLDFLKKHLNPNATMRAAVEQVWHTFQKSQNDSYILHEYLEQNNNQFFFIEFFEQIKKHNLNYVGDCNLMNMFSGNLGPEVDAELSKITDPITREQYMDFVSNRQFRWSIISQPELTAKSAIDSECIPELYFTTYMSADPATTQGAVFGYKTHDETTTISSDNPIVKIVMDLVIARRGEMLSFDDFLTPIKEALKENTEEELLHTLKSVLLILVFRGALNPHSFPPRHTIIVSDKPKAYALAQYQTRTKSCDWVTNTNHVKTPVNALEVMVLRFCDGNNTATDIRNKLIAETKKGTLNIALNGVDISKSDNAAAILDEALPRTLKSLAVRKTLVA